MKLKTKNLSIFTLLIVLAVGILFIGVYFNRNIQKTDFIFISIPIGAYSSYSLDNQSYPYGAIDRNVIEKLSLDNPLHYLAQLVWFEGSGYLEYKVKNPLSKNSQVKTLRLFF